MPPAGTNINLQAGGAAVSLSASIGTALSPSVSILVLSTDGVTPVPNVTVALSVAAEGGDDVIWQRRYGYEGTLYDTHGVPVNGRYSLPGWPPAALVSPRVLGTSQVSDAHGSAYFRRLRMQFGLPATYATTATAGDLTIDAGALVFTSDVTAVTVVYAPFTPDNTTLALGAQLPPIRVRVTGAGGRPIAGKRVLLNSAPPSADEYSSFAARPDLLHPRVAILRDAVSAPTDYRGEVTIANVTLVTSSVGVAVLEAVCDGMRSPTSLSFSVAQPARLQLRVVTQPSASVMEGKPFDTQPVVQVTGEVGGVMTPLVGVVVVALPYMAAGVRTPSLLDANGVAELNWLAGTPRAVLGNVGRRKLLRNYLSAPSDSAGMAAWSGAGFISHGPAGSYTLTFAVAGVVLSVETGVIQVASSVASVEHVAADLTAGVLVSAYDVTVCTAPTCTYSFAGSAPYVSVLYGYPPYTPDAVSGGLGATVFTLVRDTDDRPLAGKAVTPVVAAADASNSGAVAAAAAIVLQEFPGPGTTRTALSDSDTATRIETEGIAVFRPQNLDVEADDSVLADAAAVGSYGSYFRVVSAPHGATPDLTLALSVEGVVSTSLPLAVTNRDGAPAAALCAALAITASPSRTTLTAQQGYAAFDVPFAVRATNSAGEPVAGVEVAMHVVDVLGTLMYSGVDNQAYDLEIEYTTYLARTGGGAAVALGPDAAAFAGQLQHSAAAVSVTDGSGIASFTSWTATLASNTYVRFAFVGTAAGSGGSGGYQGGAEQAACITPYSAPVAVYSTVAAVNWVAPPAGNVSCVADATTPLPVTPTAVFTLADGSTVPPSATDGTFFLMATIDSTFSLYPAYLGVGATALQWDNSAPAQGLAPSRRAGDINTSPLLHSQGEVVVPATFNLAVPTLFATLGHTVMYESNNVFEALTDTEVIAAIMPSATNPAALALPRLAVAAGAPGVYRFVAVAGGVTSPPWTPVACTDGVDTVVVHDWAGGADCPADHDIYSEDLQPLTTSPASVCAANCNNHGVCICGVCVCAAGWDGAADCSRAFDADAFSILFATDAQYATKYAGLPVLDVREQMERTALGVTSTTPYDVFPRFFFAGTVTVGAVSNPPAVLAYATATLPTLGFSAVAPQSLRIGDAVNAALEAGTIPQATFVPASADTYSVVPVLVTCGLVAVPQAYYTAVSPATEKYVCGLFVVGWRHSATRRSQPCPPPPPSPLQLWQRARAADYGADGAWQVRPGYPLLVCSFGDGGRSDTRVVAGPAHDAAQRAHRLLPLPVCVCAHGGRQPGLTLPD